MRSIIQFHRWYFINLQPQECVYECGGGGLRGGELMATSHCDNSNESPSQIQYFGKTTFEIDSVIRRKL